jgi:hypothetical protein
VLATITADTQIIGIVALGNKARLFSSVSLSTEFSSVFRSGSNKNQNGEINTSYLNQIFNTYKQ